MNIPSQIEKETPEDRNARANRFRDFLKRLRMPEYGAPTKIAKEIGVTPATVSGWLTGGCPRDPKILIKFCDTYDVDLYYWVNGEARPVHKLDAERLLAATERVNAVTQKKDLEYSVSQFVQILTAVYNDPIEGDKFLERMTPFFKKQTATISSINKVPWTDKDEAAN